MAVLQIALGNGGFFGKPKGPSNVFIVIEQARARIPIPDDYHGIGDYEEAMDFLQKSCGLVKKLTLHALYITSNEQRLAISESIAKHCAKSLIELEFYEADNVLISATNETFPKVASLKVHNEMLPENIRIHQIYPALQELSIENHEAMRWTDTNWAYIRAFLPSIAHIPRLEIVGEPHPILRSVAEHLPNLESLSLTDYDGDKSVNGSIHFGKIKEFKFMIRHGLFPKYHSIPFTFDRLQVLRLGTFKPYQQLLDWLPQNTELKRITVDMLTNNALLGVIGRLPKLEHVTFEVKIEYDSEVLLKPLENVKTATFVALFANDRDQILLTLPADWKVVDGWTWVNGTGYVLDVARRTSVLDKFKSKFEHWFD